MNKGIFNECKGLGADGIYDYLRRDEVVQKNPDIADKSSLFVAIAFCTSYLGGDKERLRKDAYMEFLNGVSENYPLAWGYLEMLEGKSFDGGLKVRVLKGGAYKIKRYYLENIRLDDIRGASVLLTYVEEQLIPDIITESYIRECIVYSGGGNVFAILPESAEVGFAELLEERARDILVSADMAFYLSEPIAASSLFGSDYREKMRDIENRLEERKKLIIHNRIKPISKLLGTTINIASEDVSTSVTFDGVEINGNEEKCSACEKRIGRYGVKGELPLCASCFHKRKTGMAAKHMKYYYEYIRYNREEPEEIHSLTDIDKEYISVVYGDGNNMGGIIQQLQKITDLMKFSRDVKSIANKATFEAMGAVGIASFEVVGLGGDDVFVIVPGRKAMSFAVELIERYNSQFKGKYGAQTSTMSVGIAVGKAKTPVNILLEAAEDKLSEAKVLAKKRKKEEKDNGSLSFVIMDTFGAESERGSDEAFFYSMLPYSTTVAKDVIRMARSFEGKARSKLRNLLDASENAKSADEYALYFNYMNAKASKKDRIVLPSIDGFQETNGYYRKQNGAETYYIWRDVVNLIGFCEGGTI